MTFYEAEQQLISWAMTIGYHVGAPLVSAGITLYATATPDSTGMAALVGAMGSSGVLAWYVYYTVRHVLPKKDDQIVKMQLNHDAKEKDTRDHYELVLSRQQEFHSEQRAEDRKCLNRLADALDRQTQQFHSGAWVPGESPYAANASKHNKETTA